jgi:GxxExxY protein
LFIIFDSRIYAGLLEENMLVLQLKCVDRLNNDHLAQCLNYLRASGKELCLLINFQEPVVEWKRVILPKKHDFSHLRLSEFICGSP